MLMLPLCLSNYFLRGLVYRQDLGEYGRETIRRLRERTAHDVIVTYFRSVFIHVLWKKWREREREKKRDKVDIFLSDFFPLNLNICLCIAIIAWSPSWFLNNQRLSHNCQIYGRIYYRKKMTIEKIDPVKITRDLILISMNNLMHR